ncbi:MAG TPA: cytochrome c biogenesis protein [Terriglobales bacterium]|nr:cytochrome c biogenesis protein [Terriglobales bacterium]
MKRAFPIFAVLTAALLAYGLYQALWVAPTDRLQGDVYRIIYYHVPSAWTMFSFFALNFVSSIVYLIRRNPRADAVAVASAEVGVVFNTVVLVTGPLWARPVWGIWWTWDIRLTSTLVLWLIYVSYLLLRRFSSGGQMPVLAAALAVFGALDMPLVYFSIWFFRTQHPQPVIGGGGSIDPRMLQVWLLNWIAFQCFGLLVFAARYRLEVLSQEVEEMQALESLLEVRGSR